MEATRTIRVAAHYPVKGEALPPVSPVCRMDVRIASRHSPVSMTFVVERMDLTDAEGTLQWERAATQRYGEALGPDAHGVLAAVVARDGGVQLGVAATYTDGQAVMLAQKGELIYALRARPRATVGTSNEH